MRKRIIIWLLAVVMVGVVAFFVSPPKKESLEWHKREYLAAKNGPPSRCERLRGTIGKLLGREFAAGSHGAVGITKERERRIERHRQALINLGFLQRRKIVITSAHSRAIVGRIESQSNVDEPYTSGSLREADTRQLAVVVVAEPAEIQNWEDLIRKTDLPHWEETLPKVDVR